MELIKIYALLDPITKEVKYIGQTRLTLNERLCNHVVSSFRAKLENQDQDFCYLAKSEKDKWIRELKYIRLKPIICLLATVREEDKLYWERFFMKVFEYKLINPEIIRRPKRFNDL